VNARPHRDEVMPAPREAVTDETALSIRFWGVRGSIPAPRAETVDFGGNTPCLEVTAAGRRFIVDAGSGIAALGATIAGEDVSRYDILLTHLHHDHVTGLFFFRPIFRPGVHVAIHCGNLDGETAEAPLRRLYSPPLFPISFEDVAATFSFHGFRAGEALDFGPAVKVGTCLLRHPSGATAYRFDCGGRALAIITDIEHAGPAPDPEVADFVRNCDLVVYDAMFLAPEYPACQGWGHSTLEAGVELCRVAGAKRLAAFHHNPTHDDAVLAERERWLEGQLPGSFIAREGMTLRFEAREPVAAPAAAPAGERRTAR
jgi:phosphoribosyl 1,2-cyclic phosphodiesterase